MLEARNFPIRSKGYEVPIEGYLFGVSAVMLKLGW